MSEEVFVLPTSFAQRRLWFLDQLEPNNASYNVPAAFHLPQELDLEALKRSLSEIVRRHEVLRTTFSVLNDQAVQVVAPALPLTLPVVDLSELDRGMREAETDRLTEQ